MKQTNITSKHFSDIENFDQSISPVPDVNEMVHCTAPTADQSLLLALVPSYPLPQLPQLGQHMLGTKQQRFKYNLIPKKKQAEMLA